MISISTAIANCAGHHVLRSSYSLSTTGTLANHSLDLVAADDMAADLATADEVSSAPIATDEAADAYSATPGAESRDSYLGYGYAAVTATWCAKGCNAGTRVTYVLPVTGW